MAIESFAFNFDFTLISGELFIPCCAAGVNVKLKLKAHDASLFNHYVLLSKCSKYISRRGNSHRIRAGYFFDDQHDTKLWQDGISFVLQVVGHNCHCVKIGWGFSGI